MSQPTPSGWRRPRGVSKVLGVGVVLVTLVSARPGEVAAQLSAPCEAACALVLAASSYAVGTGAVVAWGRHTGGITNANHGTWVWASGFALAAGAGVALSGNGERQERAVYAAGLGVLAGATVGLVVGSMRSQGSGTRRLAATLIGAGAGALIGGVYGALSHDEHDGPAMQAPPRVTLLTISWTP